MFATNFAFAVSNSSFCFDSYFCFIIVTASEFQRYFDRRDSLSLDKSLLSDCEVFPLNLCEMVSKILLAFGLNLGAIRQFWIAKDSTGQSRFSLDLTLIDIPFINTNNPFL